jgi:uncharacterized damage-inducible protein DinB
VWRAVTQPDLRYLKEATYVEPSMKPTLISLLLCLSLGAYAQSKSPTDLRGVLLEQLQTVHNKKDWFVPINVAVDGITADQANWTDGKGNHSVGQLTYHILFWNKRALADFKGEKSAKFSGNNEETFNNFDAKQWAATVKELDEVMTEFEKAVQSADEARLQKNASLVAHVGTHTAYHLGQILYVRREQGSWNPENGVK